MEKAGQGKEHHHILAPLIANKKPTLARPHRCLARAGLNPMAKEPEWVIPPSTQLESSKRAV
jgi:hypothetical protein